MRRILPAHLALALLVFALPMLNASAQGVTTAQISGIVVESDGTPMPGANVVAVHEPTGTRYGVTTRSDGRFNLTGLQVGGPYAVTASFIGYIEAVERGFNLALGENRAINFRLDEAEFELGEIQVLGVASATFSAARTGSSTNVSTEQIEALPTISRSIQDFTRLSPQVAGNNVGGRNNRYNNIQLDGAILNDAFGLPASGTPGGQVNAQPISLDAIAEFQVEIAPYDVRRSGFTGGLINAVTRRGTNTFDGSAYFFGRNQGFVGQNLAGVDQPIDEFGEFQTGFRLGGPIIRDRAFFFLSGELVRRNDPLEVGLQGSGLPTEFGATQAEIQRIVNIAQAYGVDAGSAATFDRSTQDNKIFGRLDVNLAQNHRLTLRHNYVDAFADRGITRGRTAYSLSTEGYEFRSVQNSTVAQLNSTFGNDFASEARLVYTRVRDQRDYGSMAQTPSINVQIDRAANRTAEVRFGMERSSQANALDQDIFEFALNGTYFAGNHTFTFGTDNELSHFSNLFIQDVYGTYNFNSIEDFEAGRPSRYRFSYANPNTPGLDPMPRADWSMFRAGAFVQDQWRAHPRLNLTIGLRVDVPFFLDDPLYNPAVEERFGLRTDAVPSGNLQFSPRFGFNFDVFGDRSTQFRGGVGVFSGTTPAVWLSNQYSNTGVDLLRVDASNLPAGFFSPNPNAQPRPGEVDGLTPQERTSIALTSEDFVLPQVIRGSFGIDQDLGAGFALTFEGTYSEIMNDVFFENINLGPQTATNATDGRPVFSPRLDSRFNNVILMSNASRGYTFNYTVQLQREARQGFFGNLAYTFQQAKDVNSGTSSVALSNWINNYNQGNPNAVLLRNALHERPNRVLAVASYRAPIINSRWASTFSVIYEGISGAPYSYVYDGDINNDGQRFNDLVYVPRFQSEQVISDEDWAALNSFIENDKYLSRYRGDIFPRNAARAPWHNQVDFRFAQEVPTLAGQRLELTLDILNLGNLINSDWGVLRTTFWDERIITYEGRAEDGRSIIRFSDPGDVATPSNLASRWQMQLGVRYSF
jgi:hypothetical protein